MEYLYGNFSDNQIIYTAKSMHNEIHKLLLHEDPCVEQEIFSSQEDFENYFSKLLVRYGGLNELLGAPDQMVFFMSTLQAAFTESKRENFRFRLFRKLILDAHGYLRDMFGEVKENAEHQCL